MNWTKETWINPMKVSCCLETHRWPSLQKKRGEKRLLQVKHDTFHLLIFSFSHPVYEYVSPQT